MLSQIVYNIAISINDFYMLFLDSSFINDDVLFLICIFLTVLTFVTVFFGIPFKILRFIVGLIYG